MQKFTVKMFGGLFTVSQSTYTHKHNKLYHLYGLLQETYEEYNLPWVQVLPLDQGGL